MNATTALCIAFLEGRVLSIKTAFNEFGITNLPRECGRLIERKFDVQLSRVRRTGKSRYGIDVSWFEYRLPTTEYNKEGIKKMQDYVEQNRPIKQNTGGQKPEQLNLYL